MNQRSSSSLPKVSVVIPMRNSSSTIIETLKGLKKQKYPIEEIIIVDNVSSDNSLSLVQHYAKKNPTMKIVLLQNKRNIMIARSQDRGVKKARSPYILFTHSDCRFVSSSVVSTLIRPIIEDASIIATYGGTENPLNVWNQYPFWEKVLLAKDAGKLQIPGLLGKIDCIQKNAFLSIGGHDTEGFDNYGCEDADLHLRLKQKGNIVATSAKAEHLDYTHNDFPLSKLFWKTRFIGEGYGRFLRVNGLKYGISPISYMLIKPALAIGALLPMVNLIAIPLLILLPFVYYKNVFLDRKSMRNFRIFLLPFIGIILVYYQTFWMTITYIKKPYKRTV